MDISNKQCVYCGAQAECVDHLIPVSYFSSSNRKRHIDNIANRKENLVPACNECNVLASNKVFGTLEEKRAYIQGRLEERYKKILESPDWSVEEIEEMSAHFRKIIEMNMVAKKYISKRIKYPDENPQEVRISKKMLKIMLD